MLDHMVILLYSPLYAVISNSYLIITILNMKTLNLREVKEMKALSGSC